MQIGEIYWVNFEPSFGHKYKKIRPALVIQDSEITKFSPYVTVLPITSNLNARQGKDVFISKDDKNNLFDNSVIKVQQISSFDKSRFLGRIGEVNSPILRQVRGYLRTHFKF